MTEPLTDRARPAGGVPARDGALESGGRRRGPQLDLAGVPPTALTITNQMLGEGEVSIQVGGARAFRIQESVFTGLWRVCALDGDGRLAGDWLEAGDAAARRRSTPRAPPRCRARRRSAIPAGAMNSPALLHEIAAQMRAAAPGSRAHVINLTLFPLTPDDHAVLDAALPVGPVAMMSRGFGNCRITSTRRPRRLARPVLQQHEHADPQHDRGRRRARSRARRGRGPRRQPRPARRARSTG